MGKKTTDLGLRREEVTQSEPWGLLPMCPFFFEKIKRPETEAEKKACGAHAPTPAALRGDLCLPSAAKDTNLHTKRDPSLAAGEAGQKDTFLLVLRLRWPVTDLGEDDADGWLTALS